jgi:hypothetical protein
VPHNPTLRRLAAALLLPALWLGACEPQPGDASSWEDEAFLDIPLDRYYRKPLINAWWKTLDVGFEKKGPATAGLSSATAVWAAPNRWYEVSAEAGEAWGANSGLTWDEKYAAWIDAMEQTTSEDGKVTVNLITPWGFTLPSPRLECAEMAMFLRASFAAWHGLPFFLTAWHPGVGEVYYGHFGIVDRAGNRISGSPTWALSYEDKSAEVEGKTFSGDRADWPRDAKIRGRALTTAKDDAIGFLGGEAWAGAYFDEIHPNKRAAWFMLRLLTNFGSIHLAGPENTFDIAPRSMREGDVLIERWQSQGIGHVMVVKEVDDLGDGAMGAEIIFGSMPRIQPRWYESAQSKAYFVSQYSGGSDPSPEGPPYAALHGGIKRWRTPVEKGGAWVNIVPVKDREAYISEDDLDALGARVETFREILGNLTPEEERDVILGRIQTARENLAMRPASCANRQRREEAFAELYRLGAEELSLSKTQIDAQYRAFEDYIFAELDYASSKTCCWNKSTAAMYEIIVRYNEELAEDAEAAGQCAEPVVFRAENGGYERFRAYAQSIGRGADWVAWTEDEPCNARDVSTDSLADFDGTPWCEVSEAGGGATAPTTSGGCEGLDWIGECRGNTVTWCDNNTLQTYACPSGTSCQWVDYHGYYWCE